MAPGKTIVMIGLATALALAGMADAQKAEPAAPPRVGHLEEGHDPYIPVPREGRPRTPGARVERNGYVSVQVNVDADGNNIVGDAANEPSIAVDPTNHNRMVIGWRQFDTIASDFRQAGWAYTTDGGRTWTFPGVIQPGHFRSDPVVDADSQGVFYYNSLTNDPTFQCRVFRSYDGGMSWDAGVYAYGGDKQWQVIDTTGGIGDGHIYASWNEVYSDCFGHFTRSRDGGDSYEPCTSAPGSPYWGTLAVGPDGELYLCGAGFDVVRSDDAKYPTGGMTWSLSTTVSLGGSITFSAGPNPAGLLGQAWIDVDRSGGPNDGNVYLLCSVDPPGADPLDVMFARSTDGGQTWSSPIRINDDPGTSAWQWFGTMSVAPNGRIDVIWLDTRSDPGGYDSELYYSFSEDGGLTWSPNEVLGPPFDPHLGWPQQQKMGDYFDMTSDELGADLAYAATYNGEQDVYYLRIGPSCDDAGTIELDRPKYACTDTAALTVNDCGLNTDDQVTDTVAVMIDSDTEPNGEEVLLTEIDPAAGVFEGTIAISTTDAAGVLHVAPGDTVTATYIDADNGAGGFDIVVTDTALVDCTPPVIANVQVTDVGAFSAVVTFETDEPAQGAVRYGLTCAALTEVADESGFHTTHTVTLTGLSDNTTYYFAVDAVDEAGNPATDDNGGSCYSFQTPDIPLYFTELFDSGNDLAGLSLIFTPDGGNDFYHACVEEISELPTDPSGGNVIDLSDDDSELVSPGGIAYVALYGDYYNSFYVGSNGYITFTSGDTDYTESLEDHFDLPRISALFDDLNPSSGGTVSWKQTMDRIAVTWEDVPEYGSSNTNTFQVEMFYSGKITLNYLALAATDGLAGLSAGGGIPEGFIEVDLSALGACTLLGDLNCDGVVNAFDIDPFILALTDPAAYAQQYPGCDPANGDINGDGELNAFDIDPFVELLSGG